MGRGAGKSGSPPFVKEHGEIMKYFALFLACVVLISVGTAQMKTNVVSITPVISTVTLDSTRVVSGSATIYSRQERIATLIDTTYHVSGSAVIKARGSVGKFVTGGLVHAGSRITSSSAGISAGAYIVSITNDTTLVISDTCTATSQTTGDTITFYNAPSRFASVTTGMRIIGAGIPYNATVTVVDTTTLTLSSVATASSAALSVNIGYVATTAYTSGDQVGFPFEIVTGVDLSKKLIWLQSINVTDDADQGAALELVVFDSIFTPSLDNAAFTPSDAHADNIIAVVPITTWYNFGANQVSTEPNLGIPLKLKQGQNKFYGILVTRGTPTFAAVTDLKLKLTFLVE